MSELPEVAIGGTFYNGEPFLDRYLDALYDLDYPKKKIHFVVAWSDSKDKTWEKLATYRTVHGDKYASITFAKIERSEHKEKQTALQINVCKALNKLIDLSRPHDLVVIEQDIVVPPDTVKRLQQMKAKGAAICSGVTLVTGVQASYELKDGSCLRITGLPHISAYWNIGKERRAISNPTSSFNLITLPYKNRILEVHALGTALVYLTREVMDKIKFEPQIDEFNLTAQTQDINYCDRARKLGFKIMVDTGLWHDHLHYSYRVWEGKDGSTRILLTDSLKTDFVSGFVIPKEEIERQGKTAQTVKLVVPDNIEGSHVERD